MFPRTSATEETRSESAGSHSRGGSGSVVHVIYTDHSLRESQSSHQGDISEPEDDVLFTDPFETVDQEETKVLPDIGVTVDEAEEEKAVRRSFSEIVQDGVAALTREQLRSSRSSSCVPNVCLRAHAHLNAYELCERHSFTDSRDLLCNVDFLCRLNFAANRMTEDIADEAGRELRIHYRAQANPRARYFAGTALSRQSTYSSMDDEQAAG
ncbi:unnamed protein product [Cylicostephanus goldi]|uniref:Uncharacterized protein n=1 Tax=Cylicostephanus goldi TaxID=71465 RepID=A0A3P7NG66_CYLGO|nr:unnamed protein product [Cylicostephanus goldi]